MAHPRRRHEDGSVPLRRTDADRRPIGERLREKLETVTERVRAWRRPADKIDPTLPATSSVVAVQSPAVSLPERSYDLVLVAAVLALLSIGTVAIFSSTAAD